MDNIRICTLGILCADCNDQTCWNAGKLIADCPLTHCDREGDMLEDCKSCTLMHDIRAQWKAKHEQKEEYNGKSSL